MSFFFRPSLRLFRRWTEDCDTKLMEFYDKYGPAWSLLAAQFKGRTGKECRLRWLNLSGTLEAERYDSDKKLWLEGYERTTLEDGQKGWIRVPDMEKLPENPFERMTKTLPRFRTSWIKKKAGWSEAELMTLREGYEQFIVPLRNSGASEEEINSVWDEMAKRFSRRTGAQCRNYFEKQHIFWNFQAKLSQIAEEIEKNQNSENENIEEEEQQNTA